MPENEEAAPATEGQQEAAQPSDTKAEATSTAKASDELSEDDLEAVAGGSGRGSVRQGVGEQQKEAAEERGRGWGVKP